MVVLEQHHAVGIDEVDERAVVLSQLLRGGLDLPGVGDLDRASERRAHAAEADLRHDVVDLALLAAGTAGQECSGHEQRDGERL